MTTRTVEDTRPDQDFTDLVEPHRKELLVHCYRMVGSLEEAEDLVQETMLRAWRSRGRFEGRSSLRTWLYKIATNACLDAIEKRAKRTLPQTSSSPSDPRGPIEPPPQEPVWLEPYPDGWLPDVSANPEARYSALESISMAFMVALQVLPARQRAVLVLRDVLDWKASEVARLLETTTSAVNSMLHRARTALAARTSPTPPVSQSDNRVKATLAQYVDAWESADIPGLVDLLKDDAILAMPPSPTWVQGRDEVGLFLEAYVFDGEAKDRWRMVPTSANGQPAFGLYKLNPESGSHETVGLMAVTLSPTESDVLVSDLTYFIAPQLVSRFGLPEKLTD